MRIAASILVGACAVIFLFGALAPRGEPGTDSARYRYLPARQNLWVVDETSGEVIFFKFPDREDRPIQRSKSFEIDRERFPAEKTEYLLSERELTSVFWIVNKETGDVQVLRYQRDGTVGISFNLMAAKQFE
jgi:hypothetical protein